MIPEESIRSLRAMATAMAPHMPMSSDMLTMLTDDVESRGPISRLIADHPDAAAPLFGLRALAGVRLLVLTGQAPELADHLQSLMSNLDDPAYGERTRALFRQALLDHPDEIAAAMDRPVQQHMPRRAGVLLRGLGMVAAPKVRLLEIGACAGLNLAFDRYRWFGHGWEWGDARSPVRLATTGPRPGDFEIVDRAGCDLEPRDPADSYDAMILRSFLPHEREVEQLELDDAISLAARVGTRVDRADAVEWLRKELSRPAEPGVCTVVWHSLFWWYLSSRDHLAIEDILTAAAGRIQLARICYEPHAWSGVPRLQTVLYS
ncbi:DUF2332 domain-containing protein [Streptomyces sp. NPDC051362]|uniref:DUF2332 domain-containing protein n=1 Tax=Streptomyces sp. NPDC051362 TaxID=3365651 RepID=UPI00379EE942